MLRWPIRKIEVKRFEPTPELTVGIASGKLCAGCGKELNEPQITNEKGSYHGVECYNKVN